MTRTGEGFDFVALTTLCARWPAEPVPVRVADDPLLERVRQVLGRLSQSAATGEGADLVPLIRHVLLRAAGTENPSLGCVFP